ncbi:TlpA disulfide reductase family protein [Chitinophaga sp.]|uniref:TlpA family protein disulfide reductase n=1 Tax=Chitinophaga sp. TaxID=1869181 RepID=UPI002F93A244
MKSFPLIAATLLGSIASFAGNPVATTSLNVRVGITPEYIGFMQFSHLGNTGLSEYQTENFFVAKDRPVATFSRSVDAGKQIVYLNNTPVLVNTGDKIQMMLSPKYKDGKVQPNQFSAAWTGKDAGRQGILYLVDSLYTTGAEINSVEQVDALMTTSAQQVKAAINRAKITDKENIALINAYEQTKVLFLKFSFQEAHKSLLPAKAYADWCLTGFDIGTPAFSGIGNKGMMQQILNMWWFARKMQDSTLTEGLKLPEVMKWMKSDLVKGSWLVDLLVVEGKANGFTQKFKNMYATAANLGKDASPKHSIDSLYKAYGQLEVGTPAFNFALKNDQGDIVRLSDFKGKIVIIDIWATWCTVCVAELPIYHKIKDSYKDKKDIVFLTIGLEGPDEMEYWKEFSAKKQLSGEHNLFLPNDPKDPQCKQFVERYCLSVLHWVAIDDEGKILNGNLGDAADPAFTQKIANCYKMKN